MLICDTPPSLQSLAATAAQRWNAALKRRAIVLGALEQANCVVRFGAVDRRTQPDRVAEHRFGIGIHFITLAEDRRWAVTPWQRFWGLGTDALAALLHEFGHALGLPHSDRDSDVMSPVLGSTVISDDEAARYRQFLNF